MIEVSNIDSNFKINTDIKDDELEFFDCENRPFKIYGVYKEKDCFVRMPTDTAEEISEGILCLDYNCAGGRVRFKSNTGKVAIIAKISHIGKMPHFALSGSAGFDLYGDCNHNDVFLGTYIPPLDVSEKIEGVINLPNNDIRTFTINFPLYSGVTKLYIGIEKGAVLEYPEEYKIQSPIVFYGSSITQGGCASRPGNSYEAIISRKFNCNYLNLGFSGNAKAEDKMIDYIKNLKMSVFVYDYDHNAPNIDYLEKTHKNGFDKIRNANPNLPIIIMSRPKYYLNNEEDKRFKIIKNTFINAVSGGDKNVYFIDGKSLMSIAKDNGTVDNCHPNDFGFYSMADTIIKILKTIL